MVASKNTNFSYITVSFAKLFVDGIHIMDSLTSGTILPYSDSKFEAKDCKDLVYHADIKTAKAYQKEMINK